MLRHHSDEGQSTNIAAEPVNAAAARVTPEELAAAMKVLQARRDAEAGTITIGEAISELGVDASAEELLAAVQGVRSRPTAVRRPRNRLRLLAAVVSVTCFTLSTTWVLGRVAVRQAPASVATEVSPAITDFDRAGTVDGTLSGDGTRSPGMRK
jgi:hypothetical protein